MGKVQQPQPQPQQEDPELEQQRFIKKNIITTTTTQHLFPPNFCVALYYFLYILSVHKKSVKYDP